MYVALICSKTNRCAPVVRIIKISYLCTAYPDEWVATELCCSPTQVTLIAHMQYTEPVYSTCICAKGIYKTFHSNSRTVNVWFGKFFLVVFLSTVSLPPHKNRDRSPSSPSLRTSVVLLDSIVCAIHSELPICTFNAPKLLRSIVFLTLLN